MCVWDSSILVRRDYAVAISRVRVGVVEGGGIAPIKNMFESEGRGSEVEERRWKGYQKGR